jgi:(1->4)-alpha-D-glucan 1-alpha-D-glucosylmutase
MNNRPEARIPDATYRLQFNGSFTFRDATAILAYLRDLGVSDIYASPYFHAKPGSLHGYDIIDHGALNPEIGDWDDYRAMIDALHGLAMGQVLDVVPNHMCIEDSGNTWWMDVLENGPSSPFARFFDVDWKPVKKELTDKVLIPVLGDQYGNVLENGELLLSFENGAFFISYYGHRFPVRPQTYVQILEHRMDELRGELGEDDPDLAEYLSIITALHHLPAYTEIEPGRIEERNREKEVIKRRLGALAERSAPVRYHLAQNVEQYNGAKGDPRSFDLLDALLSQQAYRLSHWRVAMEEINYRRFFDINGLIAIRMEDRDVFEAAHALVLQLVGERSVTGIRVDHPDGLYDPVEYFQRLQRACYVRCLLPVGEAGRQPDEEARLAREYDRTVVADPQYKPFYIVGEKILMRSERMPEDWPIFSTTGYVFLNSVNGLFVDGENGRLLDSVYEKFTGARRNFTDISYVSRKLVMQVAMSSEVNTLGHYLNDISEKNRHTRDFTLNSLTAALIEVIACFPVYRTYTRGPGVSEKDRQYVDYAVTRAERMNPAISRSIFDFLKDVLQLRFPKESDEGQQREWLDFVMRFQQVTGPVMAKGVEDTAFYVYNRLVSLNEVGGSPDRFGTPLETFHGQNIERAKYWPHAMIATATHDTKRGEDVRARINVLSEVPREWGERVRRWRRLNHRAKSLLDGTETPDRNDEYLLYQTLLGAWPVEDGSVQPSDELLGRVKEYMLKACREAKVNTSWVSPNEAYEGAVVRFIDAILVGPKARAFLEDFLPFQRMISHFGIYNALSQLLLKVCAPGVPDIYQGTELWDLSLVDPDNRRPVDFDRRLRMLRELDGQQQERNRRDIAWELLLAREDGRIKLYTLSRALRFRRSHHELFRDGAYLALEASGAHMAHVCAFERSRSDDAVVVVVPRLLTGLIAGTGSVPLSKAVWEDTRVLLPGTPSGATFCNVFTGEIVETVDAGGTAVVEMADVLASFPVALLERADASR